MSTPFAVSPPLPAAEPGQLNARLNWPEVAIIGLAVLATWYLCEYKHYDVLPAIGMTAIGLTSYILLVQVPKGIKQLIGHLSMLNGNIAAVNQLITLATQLGAQPTTPPPIVITPADQQTPGADSGQTGQQ